VAGHSGDTAEILILIGLILQIITVVILFGVGLVLLILPFLGGIVLFFAFIGLVFVILVYTLSYARTKEGEFEEARTPTLVFGILSLLTFGIISGILYIIAYVKLGDAADEDAAVQRNPPPAPIYPAPYTPIVTAPYAPRPPAGQSMATAAAPPPPGAYGTRFCASCGSPVVPPARFCRNCGTPLPPS